MTEVLHRAPLSSWALCPGSISPLAPVVGNCCAMDPRDKPWDDSCGVLMTTMPMREVAR